jgi:hypothetical protein
MIHHHSLLQQRHMILERILVGKVDMHRILLAELDESLVDDDSSCSPKRIVQNFNRIVESGRDFGSWDPFVIQPLIDDVTNARAHCLQYSVETIVHGVVECGHQCRSHAELLPMRDGEAVDANTDVVTPDNHSRKLARQSNSLVNRQ